MVREVVPALLQDEQHHLGPGDGGQHLQPVWLELGRSDVTHWNSSWDPQPEQKELK